VTESNASCASLVLRTGWRMRRAVASESSAMHLRLSRQRLQAGARLRAPGVDDLVRHEAGERLVQPDVVPPGHRDEVAEPLVRQLVRDQAVHVDARRAAPRARPADRPSSRKVIRPAFSIALAPKLGTASRSSFVYGYGRPK
jgi:hypothetical protein